MITPIMTISRLAKAHGYDISRHVAKGGMSNVYKGICSKTGEPVAIKVLSNEFQENHYFAVQFDKEIDALKKFNHPGIVKLLDVWEMGQLGRCIVMEWAGSETLFHTLHKRYSLTLEAAIEVGKQLALALAEVHDHGIVHCDIKPENILIKQTEHGLGVKLIDFGITVCGTLGTFEGDLQRKVLGTPQYMAPERIQERGFMDPRSDLYALGCCLYEMILGAPPFAHEDVREVLRQHLYCIPEPLPSWVPDSLGTLVMDLLSKDPSDRPTRAREVCRALEQVDLRPEEKPAALPSQRFLSVPWEGAPTSEVHHTEESLMEQNTLSDLETVMDLLERDLVQTRDLSAPELLRL